MEVGEINWHDSPIRKVVELPASDLVLLEVDYCMDWEGDDYRPHTITFSEVREYEIHEGPLEGAPTILDATASEIDEFEARTIRIETNAGFRIVRCESISIEEGVIRD